MGVGSLGVDEPPLTPLFYPFGVSLLRDEGVHWFRPPQEITEIPHKSSNPIRWEYPFDPTPSFQETNQEGEFQ